MLSPQLFLICFILNVLRKLLLRIMRNAPYFEIYWYRLKSGIPVSLVRSCKIISAVEAQPVVIPNVKNNVWFLFSLQKPFTQIITQLDWKGYLCACAARVICFPSNWNQFLRLEGSFGPHRADGNIRRYMDIEMENIQPGGSKPGVMGENSWTVPGENNEINEPRQYVQSVLCLWVCVSDTRRFSQTRR